MVFLTKNCVCTAVNRYWDPGLGMCAYGCHEAITTDIVDM